jgi:hypothetical protein
LARRNTDSGSSIVVFNFTHIPIFSHRVQWLKRAARFVISSRLSVIGVQRTAFQPLSANIEHPTSNAQRPTPNAERLTPND